MTISEESGLFLKVLVLGHSGKMGSAIRKSFGNLQPICRNSQDFDAYDSNQVSSLIIQIKPDLVINSIAFTGIDRCEIDRDRAIRLNTLFPRQLAELAEDLGFILIHFSSDAVFGDNKRTPFTEDDAPSPINMYGFTKFGGDCFVRATCKKHYIIRVPFIFGPGGDGHHLLDVLMAKVAAGETEIRVADDIITSPSFNVDIAQRVWELVANKSPYGLYHIANAGTASLYDVFSALFCELNIPVSITRASYRDFPYKGRKNICTPLSSLHMAPLRIWREALKEYCLMAT